MIVACVNILWRIAYGFLFQQASIETVRFEVQSPANSWLAAWIGCSILLRGRFHWSSIVACGVLVTLGYLNDLYAGLAIGALGGSGARAIASRAGAPPAGGG